MGFKHTILTEYHFFFLLPGSCQMEGIIDLYNYICIYLIGILFFVSTLLYLVIKLHLDGARHIDQYTTESKNEFTLWMWFVWNWTHSTSLELIWTIIPTLILIAIAVPSFILLYALDEIVDCQCVVKIIGYQWYWKYEYPVNYVFSEPFNLSDEVINVGVLSYMLPVEDLTDDYPLRLLEVDMPLVLPHSVNVKLIITAKDVLHSFAVPALGLKMDAVPGRLNQITVFIFQPGVYYGQCSELCGVNHGFMPIVLHAISWDLYNDFLYSLTSLQNSEELQVLEHNAYLEILRIAEELDTAITETTTTQNEDIKETFVEFSDVESK